MLKKVLILSLFLVLMLSVSVAAYDIQGGTVITESAVNLRSGPSTGDAVLDKLYTGTRVAVLDQTDVWLKVAFDGNMGYLHSDYVELQPIMNIQPGGAKVNTSVLNLREKPTTDSEIITRLSEGTVTRVIGINTGWFKVETEGGKTGYIHPDYVDIVANTLSTRSTAGTGTSSTGGGHAVVNVENLSETRAAILEYAATLLGVRYKAGGNSPSGFDCSGFTSYVYAHFDIKLSRSSADQYKSSVKKIDVSALQPGDLLFWSNGRKGVVGHVGIYVGNGEFIHSPSPGGVVEYESMDATYYKTRFIGCGTVLGE